MLFLEFTKGVCFISPINPQNGWNIMHVWKKIDELHKKVGSYSNSN